MHADPQDRRVETTRPRGPSRGIILAAVAVIAAVAWYMFGGQPEEPPPAPPEPPQIAPEPVTPKPAAELPPAPDIPEPQPAPEPPPEVQEPVVPPEPPPTLEGSDEELRLRLGAATDSPLVATAAGKDQLVERLAGSIDSLSQGVPAYKALPLPPPPGKFAVAPAGSKLVLDPVNFQRYDAHAQMIEGLDTELLVSTFHRFRPLLEEAYAGLGHEAEDFDNAVIRFLDQVLATQPLDGAAELVKSEAVYKYADPELEARSELQKLLMRMGPENLERVQNQAANLRAALLSGE
jgi:hypothetical protein